MPKISCISDAQKEIVESILVDATQEQRDALTALAADMYRQGWMDVSAILLVISLGVGAIALATPLIKNR